jgi:hypothetical protein
MEADRPNSPEAGRPIPGTNCGTVAYQAGVSGYMMGGVFGLMLGGTNYLRARQAGIAVNAVKHIGIPSFRSAFGFASFLLGYNGGICLLEGIRGKRDYINAGVAGLTVGFLASLPGYLVPASGMPMAYQNPRLVLANSLVTGALGAALFAWTHPGEALSDSDEPPRQSPPQQARPQTGTKPSSEFLSDPWSAPPRA